MKPMKKITWQFGTIYDKEGNVGHVSTIQIDLFIQDNILPVLSELNGGYISRTVDYVMWNKGGELVQTINAIVPDISDINKIATDIAEKYEKLFFQESTVCWITDITVKL